MGYHGLYDGYEDVYDERGGVGVGVGIGLLGRWYEWSVACVGGGEV